MSLKPFSISHVVSLIALMVSIISINAITYFYMHSLNNVQFMFLQLTNITYGVGMSYYAVRFAMSNQGVQIQSEVKQS